MVEGNEVDPPPPQHSFETDIVGETEEDTSALILNGNDSEIKTVLILVGTCLLVVSPRMHSFVLILTN